MLARPAFHTLSPVVCQPRHDPSSTLPVLSFQSLTNCLKFATLLRALCFQQLPTVKFSKSFVLITIQIAGVYPPDLMELRLVELGSAVAVLGGVEKLVERGAVIKFAAQPDGPDFCGERCCVTRAR